MSESPRNIEKSAQKPFWKDARSALGAVLALFAFAEAAKIGTRPLDIQAEYEEELDAARAAYAEHEATCGIQGDKSDCVSFPMFLSDRGTLSPEDMSAIMRLIGEFKYPVHFYSGSTLAQKFFSFIGRHTSAGGMYGHGFPISIFGHEIYLSDFDSREQAQSRLTMADLGTVLAELAHAYQTEVGRDPLFDLPSGMHIFSKEGYRGAYADPRTAEYDAHTKIERRIAQRAEMLHDAMRTYIGSTLFEYLEVRPHGDAALSMTYELYEQLLQKIELDVNKEEYEYRAEDILETLESLPGFSARLTQLPDKTMQLHIIPSEKHHAALVAFLGPYEQTTGVTITDILSEQEDSSATVRAFSQYEHGREQFFSAAHNFPFMVAVMLNGIGPEQEFTREVYETILQSLARDYDALINTKYYQAEPLMQEKIMLLQFVNNVCKYDPSCGPGYGVLPPTESRQSPRRAEVRMGDAHYEALRRIFDRAHHPERFTDEPAAQRSLYGR